MRRRKSWIWKEEGDSTETRLRQHIVDLLLVNVEVLKVIATKFIVVVTTIASVVVIMVVVMVMVVVVPIVER